MHVETASESRKATWKGLVERLQDPTQLRTVLTGLLLIVGYIGIYVPLNDRIEQTMQKLNKQRKRQQLADEIEHLQTQVAKFQARVPQNTDANEWVEYLLGGIRQHPLKLLNLDSKPERNLTPFSAVVFHMEVEGEFGAIDAFLHWIESNNRLFHVDSAKIAASTKGEDRLVLDIVLMGVKS